ncbi:MAG: site-specific integrase [Usitatibacter sp.]
MASIQKTKNGTWRVQIEMRGRRDYKTFPTKALAIGWANERETDMAQGKVRSSSQAERTPFATVIQTYRVRELPKLRNRSSKFMLNTLEQRFGRYRLVDLQMKDFANFRDDRLDDDLAPATVLKELNLARRLIDYAIKDLSIYLPSNTARLVDNPHVENDRDRVFISDEEEQRLFEAFPNDNYRHIGALALESACRLGEMLKMEWHHVDFTRRTLTVPKPNTKTEVKKTVPLSSRAIAILESRPGRRRGRVFNCWAAGDSFQNGYKRAIVRARKKYESDCELAGQEPHPELLVDLRFHDFRHIATSRLAKFFPNVIELSMVTGHQDLKMLKRYYHTTPEELAKRLP